MMKSVAACDKPSVGHVGGHSKGCYAASDSLNLSISIREGEESNDDSLVAASERGGAPW